jgi:chorismate synthase
MFGGVENRLAQILYGIPAVKNVGFGSSEEYALLRGSDANDPFCAESDGTLSTLTNRNGGINGGITNGMPLRFRCAIKPTPSIAKLQQTADFLAGENLDLQITGRHDPCIAHRARAVVDAVTAIVLCDLLAGRFGTDWMGGADA